MSDVMQVPAFVPVVSQLADGSHSMVSKENTIMRIQKTIYTFIAKILILGMLKMVAKTCLYEKMAK
jgi:hypothetical protein